MRSKALLGFFVLTVVSCGGSEAPPEGQADASPPAQQETNRAVAEATIGGKKISIDYGTPKLDGRDMLAKASAGMVWRLGRDEATTINSEATMVFGDKTIPAGEYTLFARKTGDQSWELLINSVTGLWGSTDYDSSKDVAVVPLEASQTDQPLESFTIAIESDSDDSGRLSFLWGTLKLSTAFQVS